MENSLVGPSVSLYSSYEHYLDTGAECWLIAENTAQNILSVVQPTAVSLETRFEIINYIRELIREHVGEEVLVFGSLPLKTYLPDGDIDLTVLSSDNNVEYLARSISSILGEQISDDSPVIDVEVVDAKVKIVKCLVLHVPVDISFNQVAGLNTLCFLEQIDQHIGRDHLFKRSIILIKAWCFYESRILGSHCGLMSTYALEILILYIINLFHSSLNGPLAVLYKFLDYYSTFDWDRYCISLNGPVDLNFLPTVVATGGTGLLLGENFLESCIRSFSVPTSVYQTELQGFQRKYLNIIDPLKLKNNLGRSINQANFFRIKLALSYGCQKLRDILQLPVESIGDSLMMFFVNTFGRNARQEMLDEVPALDYNSRICQLSDLKGDYDCPIECLNYVQWCINSNLDILQQPSLPITPWLMQSQIIKTHITPDIYYPWDANGLVSSSLYHPNTYSLFHSVSSGDETSKYPGQSRCVPSMSSKGKFKLSASAPPFVSSAVGKKVKCEGTGLFIPKVGVERWTKSEETNAQCYGWQMNLSEMVWKFRGLMGESSMGNRVVNNVPSKLNGVVGRSCFDPSRLLPSCEESSESAHLVPPCEKEGESSCFDLSLEHFPLLPSCKKAIQSEKRNDAQVTGREGSSFASLVISSTEVEKQ